MDTKKVPLKKAVGRVLAAPVVAQITQPPFAASVMDGYALNGIEADDDAQFMVIGESAAGHRFEGKIGAGQAVRIFTGAPIPEGATRVIIQEDVTVSGKIITLGKNMDAGPYIRPAGADFAKGDTIDAPRRITASDVALFAAMNVPMVEVFKRPRVAIIATGDELVTPGDTPGPDQIIASNNYGLFALCKTLGAKPKLLPVARDTEQSLKAAFGKAQGADLIVTIGGASVGDHDLVGKVAETMGMERAFYKVAMRPGKPLMAGRLGGTAMIGLPGNPVSSMVCGHLFMAPMIRAMMGFDKSPPMRLRAKLTTAISANGPREHFMRATIQDGEITAYSRQDSALLTVLANANALLVRPPHGDALQAGDMVDYIAL
ncbi:MAG: gephyrin-like molybdotransferase Glp [Halocynthiibacter sp.]